MQSLNISSVAQESLFKSQKDNGDKSTNSKISSPQVPSPKSLSNDALLRNTHALVAEERKLTTEILWHLHEIQVRRLYAEKGYSSLFEYAVQGLGYSEAAAGRRVAAMRLLVEVPEIESALQEGAITLSTLSTIQSFIQRKNSKRKNEPISKTEKKELIMSLQGKSKRECEKVLIELDPVAALPKERERVVSSTQTEIRFIADDELMQKLQEIKERDGHVQSNPSYLELFHRMADLALKELNPISQTQRAASHTSKNASASNPGNLISSGEPVASNSNHTLASNPSTPPAEPEKQTNPRYIPAALKRDVWKRDQSQCTYKSPDGKRCTSRFALQIDHITPVAWGGKSGLSNLQLLCREHNRLKAVSQLGPSLMQKFIR